MTTGSLSSVMQRMAQIDARFGRSVPATIIDQPTPPTSTGGSTGLGTTPVASAPDFRSVFERTAADPAAVLAGSTSTSVATPLATTAAHPLDAMVDQLAAAGMLPVLPERSAAHAPGSTGIGSNLAGPADDEVALVDPTAAITPPAHSSTIATAVPSGTPFAAEFELAAARHGVPARLLAAVGWVESRYQTDAVSPDGAMGVMQIMPMTARELGVDPHDPIDAIDGAARLLADHQRRFGSWDLALAAYHSGAGAVSRNGNVAPPRAATYVQRVHDRLEHM